MPSPYTLALGWLARRELSERQVRTRLARRGFDEAEIDAAVEQLRQERALDDRRVAGAYVRDAVRLKGRGPARVRRDLEALGIDRTAAAEAVAETFAEVSEDDLIRAALARKQRGNPAPVGRLEAARLFRALVRQGFSPEKVRAALGDLDAD